jgi:hypothetical protein
VGEVRQDVMNSSRITAVMPAKAGIQYAAAIAVNSLTLWNTGSRLRGDAAEIADTTLPT